MSNPHHSAAACTIPTSISRTALDSLHAKLSAIDAGWLDGGEELGGRRDECDDGDGRERREGGDGSNVASPVDGYHRLLQRISWGVDGGELKVRRQTPLVNAGYAARVAVVTFLLERWMDSVVLRASSSSECINVVLLGCGMDALGIWSMQLLRRIGNEREKAVGEEHLPIVKVYEFDAWDNCILKRRALLDSGMLDESNPIEGACGTINGAESSFEIVSTGNINLGGTGNRLHRDGDDYSLTALDLRDTIVNDDGEESILSDAMHSTGLDPSKPTIVVSELVLAYLGNDGANATMRSIAKVLRKSKYSTFACLEPVFPYEPNDASRDKCSGNGVRILSVEESYAWDYGRQFRCKLQRGNSKQAPGNGGNADQCWFQPLGSNARNVQTRMERCGFSSFETDCMSLGAAAAHVARIRRTSGVGAPGFLRAKEPFDEHAALALNMNCYGVVCAYPEGSFATVMENVEWKSDMCPWSEPKSYDIHPIASSKEDMQVRHVYGRIYVHLYDEYPAIRKMVKSALKTDLRSNATKDGENPSTIRSQFQDKGGDFWVATGTTDEARIMGCIGISVRKKMDDVETEKSSTVVEYEIQRLAVDDQCRGKGVGRRLLHVAEEHARHCGEEKAEKKSESAYVTIKVWAATPQCLLAANSLYESSGYWLEETFRAGLVMNVYCKSLVSQNRD